MVMRRPRGVLSGLGTELADGVTEIGSGVCSGSTTGALTGRRFGCPIGPGAVDTGSPDPGAATRAATLPAAESAAAAFGGADSGCDRRFGAGLTLARDRSGVPARGPRSPFAALSAVPGRPGAAGAEPTGAADAESASAVAIAAHTPNATARPPTQRAGRVRAGRVTRT